MSVTCCPLEGSDDGGPSCWTQAQPTANREHRCCECRETIPIGAKYERYTGIWDGTPGAYKTCLSCVEIRDHFDCNGFVFGQLWEDLRGNFFPGMTAGGPCMEGLSPAAKARLFERRMAWMFDTGEVRDGAPPPRKEPS
jgi:hypothetical protein